MGSSTLSKDHPTLLSNSGPDQEYDLELDLMVLLARAKYQVKRFHFQLAASLCLERTGAVKSAPQARAKRALDGLTGQTVVSTENRVGCGAFGHAISPQFTPSEARSAEISCCDIHLTIFIASEIPTFVSYSPLRRRLTTNHARDCAQVYVAHRKAGQKRLGTSPLATTRSQPGNPWEVAITPMVLPCHEPSLLSSPAARCGSQGRTKIFFDCARATVAMRLSGSVALVIVGSDIAVRGAEPQPGRNSSA